MAEEIFSTPRGSITRSELLRVSEILKSHSDILGLRLRYNEVTNPKRTKEIMNAAADYSEKIKGLF